MCVSVRACVCARARARVRARACARARARVRVCACVCMRVRASTCALVCLFEHVDWCVSLIERARVRNQSQEKNENRAGIWNLTYGS